MTIGIEFSRSPRIQPALTSSSLYPHCPPDSLPLSPQHGMLIPCQPFTQVLSPTMPSHLPQQIPQGPSVSSLPSEPPWLLRALCDQWPCIPIEDQLFYQLCAVSSLKRLGACGRQGLCPEILCPEIPRPQHSAEPRVHQLMGKS